jgi:enamine deaminase RidA (YjgF/YER057c/UK114 family)
VRAQIEQAFDNIEAVLKEAGGKGCSQIFRVNSYHVPMNDEALETMIATMTKRISGHHPIWTAVGVPRLGIEAMMVEIEVVALDPK